MSYSKRSSTHNLKAKLAADYNDLLKELSSHEITSVGCYTVGETIGHGSYGKVKLGAHKLTGQPVAVKKISKQHASLIAREIHHHRQLEHPNIVRIYEIMPTETAIYLFAEYCPNGELFDLLTATGRFEEALAQRYFHQLTSAVAACHRLGIVHRDLKLENILLDANDNCKVADFGFARFADQKQLLDTFCGSLAYSAPEMILREKYTGPETDLWSLGVILYTLLAGELPFDDDSEAVVQRKIVNVDYSMPSYFSLDVQDLIRGILKRDPADRLTMDQITQHPWMQANLAPSSLVDDDDDDELIDFDDSLSASTRNSSRSDLDSIFSNKPYADDDDDLVTEMSSQHNSMILDSGMTSSSHSSPPPASSSRRTTLVVSNDQLQQHQHQHQQPQQQQQHAARFSPQVRFSLGMLRPEDKARYAAAANRPPRYSAPSVHRHSNGSSLASSNPSLTNATPGMTTNNYNRTSLPLSLSQSASASALYQRPSSLQSLDGLATGSHASIGSTMSQSSQSSLSAMSATEQKLATALMAAGFDQYIVQSMRTNVCSTTNTLWNMLLEKQQHNNLPLAHATSQITHESLHSSKLSLANDRWSLLRTPTPPMPEKRPVAAVDAGCQTTTTSSSSTTMTSTPTPTPTTLDTESKCAPLTIITQHPFVLDPNGHPIAKTSSSSSPRSITSLSSSVSSSAASLASTPPASEKQGWLSSVKSWFNSGQKESLQHGRPLASYRDFDVRRPPLDDDFNVSPVYRSGSLKSRRHLMPFPAPDIADLTSSRPPSAAYPKQSHSTMSAMLVPPQTTTSAPVSPAASVHGSANAKLPALNPWTAKPTSLATPTQPNEKRYSVYRPLPPPPSSYTNSSRKSNNRQCYQQPTNAANAPKPTSPGVQHQPSPPPSPEDTKQVQLPLTHLEKTTPAAAAAAPPSPPSPPCPAPKPPMAPQSIAPAPPQPASSPIPTTITSTNKPVLTESLKSSAPLPRPMPILGPKSNGMPSRRMEFAPRSRLSIYGMNDRPKMASKAIIEEEEEEEE